MLMLTRLCMYISWGSRIVQIRFRVYFDGCHQKQGRGESTFLQKHDACDYDYDYDDYCYSYYSYYSYSSSYYYYYHYYYYSYYHYYYYYSCCRYHYDYH